MHLVNLVSSSAVNKRISFIDFLSITNATRPVLLSHGHRPPTIPFKVDQFTAFEILGTTPFEYLSTASSDYIHSNECFPMNRSK